MHVVDVGEMELEELREDGKNLLVEQRVVGGYLKKQTRYMGVHIENELLLLLIKLYNHQVKTEY